MNLSDHLASLSEASIDDADTIPFVQNGALVKITRADLLSGLTALVALLAPKASPTFTGTVSGITKAMVGLGNAENTSDAAKNSATATLTNKTIDGTFNTLQNIPLSAVTSLAATLAGLAGKQDALSGGSYIDLSGTTIGVDLPALDTRFARVFTSMPDASVGQDGDCGVLSSSGRVSFITRINGSWGADTELSPTRMTATGTFRNGPGLYSGLTVVSGSGAISVYDGPDATLGALTHSIPAASVGAYPLTEVAITNGWIVLGSGLVVDIDVDD